MTTANLPFTTDAGFAPGVPDGRFHYLCEYRLPSYVLSPADARQRVSLQMAALDQVSAVSAVLADDRWDGYPGFSHEELLEMLSGGACRRVIVTVAGKSCTREQVQRRLTSLHERGFRDILAVTGDLPRQDFVSREGAMEFTAATEIITMAREMGFHVGGALNPYQYTRPMMILQHAKMMKKLGKGAEFLALQAGWDMKKLQELQWLFAEQEMTVPVFPRITWIRPDELSSLKQALPAGALVPELLVREMVHEARQGAESYTEIQLRRLALQIAGCRRCGCSGVLLRGFEEDMELLPRLIELADKLSGEYADFDSWLKAWDEEMSEYTLPPSLYQEYLYQHLMQPTRGEAPLFKPEVFRSVMPESTLRERLTARFIQYGAAPERAEWLRKAAARLASCSPDELERLEECLWLPSSACPRNLCDGVCGNADTDGNCDAAPGTPCFFRRVLALAVATERVHLLSGRSEARNEAETEPAENE